MRKAVLIVGLMTSLGFLLAAYAVTPQARDAGLRADRSLGNGCVTRQIALDEGYGVSRTETHLVCADK
jgi:hypothetical protein